MVLSLDLLKCDREKIVRALQAEGVPGITSGYQNIHLLPMYQHKIAFGSSGFPWNSEFCKRDVSYKKGICPIAEKLQDETYIGLGICQYDLDDSEVDLIIEAFNKVWSNIDNLRYDC
jgi:dTDP-4-amino-4,6-dideoxygalactose transaminase